MKYMLDTSVSLRSVSYQRKIGDWIFSENFLLTYSYGLGYAAVGIAYYIASNENVIMNDDGHGRSRIISK
jgi:hypothetical protein